MGTLRKIGNIISQSASIFASVFMLLFILMQTYTILGLHLFGHVTISPDAQTTSNFNNYPRALATIFHVSRSSAREAGRDFSEAYRACMKVSSALVRFESSMRLCRFCAWTTGRW